MKVLLTRDVDKLGKAGALKTVADGYARNYLIPQGLAVYASPGALKQVETIRRMEQKRQTQLANEVATVVDRLNGVTLKFQARASETGKLYGSITTKQVVEALETEIGAAIDKRKLDMREPIRSLGLHTIRVHLATDLNPSFDVLVEREALAGPEAGSAVEPETEEQTAEAEAEA
ncbi:MAG TPA: 50S ribosomal protein L9 [Anaerolineae bacterium]|nr:50S ribosomal protein L9 [Anaerolineae bacterium]